MFCYILGEAAVDELFYSRFTFNFCSYLDFCSAWEWFINQGNHATISNIIITNWFEKFLVSYSIIVIPKVSHTWIIIPWSWRSLPTKVVFERILTKLFSQYVLDLMLKKKLDSFNNFLVGLFCRVSLALLTRILPILIILQENITKPQKSLIIDRRKWN